MSDLSVAGDGPGRFTVEVRQGGSTTTHSVEASSATLEGLGLGAADPERVVRESFEFLLEREPATSILRQFSLDVIPRYFPEYRDELRRRLA
ncbi:MAG: hypothetical protein QOJ69_1953 [Actinomycetota bacterium]|nr:hypothetical protein [Actinomycetota bacterium]MEA2844282.1 hypothetical protein [Actinomycetota bacterium]